MTTSLLHVLASGQGALFTAKQARQAGCTRRDIDRMLRDGAARRVARGVFSVAPPSPDARIDHLERVLATALQLSDSVAASHQSALVLYGLPTFGVSLRQLRFVRLTAGDSLRRPDLRIVRNSFEVGIRTVQGVRVVCPEVAVAQAARDAGIEAGVMAADAMVRSGLASARDLQAVVETMHRAPGIERVRRVCALVDPRSESPYESLIRVLATHAGIELEPQFEVREAHGRLIGRADFRLSGTRCLVEYDGEGKYDVPGSLYAEKKREDALRTAGWSVLRLVKDDVRPPYPFLNRLRAAIRSHL